MNVYEKDLEFLGLVVMRNMLKECTVKTINILNEANIRSVMVTGDNLMTALSVAKECSITRPEEDIIIVETDQTTDGNSKPELKLKFYQKENHENTNYSQLIEIGPNER